MYDAIVSNVKIYDGSGSLPFYADVAVSDGRIAAVGAGIKYLKRFILPERVNDLAHNIFSARKLVAAQDMHHAYFQCFMHTFHVCPPPLGRVKLTRGLPPRLAPAGYARKARISFALRLNCASGEALKVIRGRSVLTYVTGADNFRNEASGVS